MSVASATPPLSAFPPIRLCQFAKDAGLSLATLWRYRRRGWLRTVLVSGQHFVTREAIAEFNARAERGELSGPPRNPRALAKMPGRSTLPAATQSPALCA
ncbi:MAG: hypothetical protein IAE97_05510 [Chthoniobacterales bacterium]|nr:hypothetical protein [Chthoniobacterales bacterium]